MLLTPRERQVIEAMRQVSELDQLRRTVFGIERVLTDYNVAITSPLSDAIRNVLEERDRLRSKIDS